jgi:hypothetical protein
MRKWLWQRQLRRALELKYKWEARRDAMLTSTSTHHEWLEDQRILACGKAAQYDARVRFLIDHKPYG